MPVIIEEEDPGAQVALVVGGHGAVNLTGLPEIPPANWFRPDQWAVAPAEFGLQNLGASGYQSVVRSQERDRRVAFLLQDAAGDREDLYEPFPVVSQNPRVLVGRRAGLAMEEIPSQASFAAPDVVLPSRPR